MTSRIDDAVQKLTYNVPEFGRVVGIGRNLAHEAVRSGRVRAVRIGKRLLVPRTEVERLLAEATARNQGPRKDEI